MITDGRVISRELDNDIDTPTQSHDHGFHLTVARIGRVVEGGSLDFGGSEAEEANFEWLEPEERSEEDDYGWWDLTSGSFVVEYNEQLADDAFAIVHPLERLIRAGGSHSTFCVENPDEPIRSLLRVGGEGLSVKENARLSRLTLRTTHHATPAE